MKIYMNLKSESGIGPLAGLLLLGGVTFVVTGLIVGGTILGMALVNRPTGPAMDRVIEGKATDEDYKRLQNAGKSLELSGKIGGAGASLAGQGGPVPNVVNPGNVIIPRVPKLIDKAVEDLPKIKQKMQDLPKKIRGEKASRTGQLGEALGEGVTSPRGVPAGVQVQSGRTAAGDIGRSQQQTIEKIRQERQDLVDSQNRRQDLINQSNNRRGKVSKSWDRARQDWDRVIRNKARPRPGVCGSSGTSKPPWGTSSDHAHDAAGRDI